MSEFFDLDDAQTDSEKLSEICVHYAALSACINAWLVAVAPESEISIGLVMAMREIANSIGREAGAI